MTRHYTSRHEETLSAPRPKRKNIPRRTKDIVLARQGGICLCGCGSSDKLEFDHVPALRLRDLTPDGKEYIPGQHSASHIVARCKPSHRAKTSGTGATTAGSDIGAIKKERKRSRKPKFKRKIANRGFQKPPPSYNAWTKRIER